MIKVRINLIIENILQEKFLYSNTQFRILP